MKRAASPCKRRPCPGLVRDGVCSVCGPTQKPGQRELDERRGTAAQRGYGSRWRRLRLMQLRANPLCVECAKLGRVVAATDVDHIIPKRDGGTDEASNLQSLCHAHHSQKTGSGA